MSGLSRRGFLGGGTLAAAGALLVRFPLPTQSEETAPSVSFDAYIRLYESGVVELSIPVPEVGQGIRTALAMVLAEELDADWSTVRVTQLTADPEHGGMMVGGSASIATYFDPLRRAGARARATLVRAAAREWKVSEDECRVSSGRVHHESSGRRLDFGQLVRSVSSRPLPGEPELTPPEKWTILGSDRPGIDLREIVTGEARFGSDVGLPGLLYAVIDRPPVPGAHVKESNRQSAEEISGVVAIELLPTVRLSSRYSATRGGIAVIAETTWAALQGREALQTTWEGGADDCGEEDLRTRLGDALGKPATSVPRDEGDVDGALDRADRRIEASYELPMIAHACMEPMGFAADVRADRCEAWGAVQDPRGLQDDVAALLQLPRAAVRVRPTLEGGGFGRRLAYDYAIEAVLLSKRLAKPLRVQWTREDDLCFDYFRAPSRHRMTAGLDASGALVAWKQHIATPPLREHIDGPEVSEPEYYDLRGADVPFAVENVRLEHSAVSIELQMGSWRSVSHSVNAFAVSCFFDEVAHAAGEDPLSFLLDLLGSEGERVVRFRLRGGRSQESWNLAVARRVLEEVGQLSAWGSPLPRRVGRGLALSRFKETYVAQVAEVAVEGSGEVDVRRVFTALDCGIAVHPDGIEAQVEGGVMDGVATALHWRMPWKNGRVLADNFDSYPMLRIGEAPDVVTRILPSQRPPSGMGEPPYPAVAPAIANAVFDATEKRIRRLPINPADLAR